MEPCFGIFATTIGKKSLRIGFANRKNIDCWVELTKQEKGRRCFEDASMR